MVHQRYKKAFMGIYTKYNRNSEINSVQTFIMYKQLYHN